jgi:Uma2 family endonuclease
MTADELLVFTGPGRQELVRGELIEMDWNGFEHGCIATLITFFIGNHVEECRLGAVTGPNCGFQFESDPDTVLAPDAAFVRAERLPPRDERIGYLKLAPDLVVEIISPQDLAGPMAAKINFYLAAGVQLVWVFYPGERTVTAYTPDRTARILSAEEMLDGGEVLPGFSVRVAEFFE